MAKISYKDHLRHHATQQRPNYKNEKILLDCFPYKSELIAFLEKTLDAKESMPHRVNSRCQSVEQKSKIEPSVIPYLFPTRPYTAQEISLFLPNECVFSSINEDTFEPTKNWAKYIRALRGIWVRDSLNKDGNSIKYSPKDSGRNDFKVAMLDDLKANKPILLGISSLKTTDETWKAAATGISDISRSRHKRIERIVNQAIQAVPRPTHLLLPELSLPERWVDTVSTLLRNSNISLIAGLDYHVNNFNNSIYSEAVLVLADNRLGFQTHVEIRQPKTLPAPLEDFYLIRDFGKSWLYFDPPNFPKPIYIHNGFTFGVLICSELQNINYRKFFQGYVDCLMVLSWNQDLDTFASLVDSASLDVHAYIALVNNRMFGDSRVRVPAKASYLRDLCRLRGGRNEHIVVVEIDNKILRSFQSRSKRWPHESDPFKPVPEGFEIANYREEIPR
jgi:hypothetical protein